ncbi:MAG: DUF1194 domain-containing protein [Acetobacteraceae bacterium]|nr:DUF1194 domain-containing protein [Acetobacteraceae bacterium]
MVCRAAAQGVQPGVAEPVDLELQLALDVSRSMDPYEQELQFKGYAGALMDPRIHEAIGSGAVGAIAVMIFIWSDYHIQETLIGWTRLATADDCNAFAQAVLEAPRRIYLYTSISGAIDYAMRQWGTHFEGTRRVIDISGDGVNNSGRPVAAARDEALAQGIVINGLPVINDRPDPFPMRQPPLDDYYREQVIGGPGSFVEVATGFEAFDAAVRRKLLREIAGLPGQHPAIG